MCHFYFRHVKLNKAIFLNVAPWKSIYALHSLYAVNHFMMRVSLSFSRNSADILESHIELTHFHEVCVIDCVCEHALVL